jgi:hypothetical protein
MANTEKKSLVIPPPKTELLAPPFEELTLLIFGLPGSGKTRFCAGDKTAIFAATEPGQDFINNPVVKVRTWDTFKSLIYELANLKKASKLTHTGLVIDIIDNLNVYCRDAVCKAKGLTYPSEKDFGKTWAECNKEWKDWLRVAMDIVPVRYITHCTTTLVEVPLASGIKQEVTRYVPTFSGNRAAQYLDGVVSAYGYVTEQLDGTHVITFKQEATVAAKDRTDILAKLGTMPLEWSKVSDAYKVKAQELGFKIVSNRGGNQQ